MECRDSHIALSIKILLHSVLKNSGRLKKYVHKIRSVKVTYSTLFEYFTSLKISIGNIKYI